MGMKRYAHAQAADLEEMVKRYPPILRQDPGELRAKMAFLTETLKLPPTRKTWRARDGSKFQWHGIVTFPLYFTLGLATYIGEDRFIKQLLQSTAPVREGCTFR